MAVAHPELLWVVVTSGLVGAFLAMAIGANDVANAFSTSVGSGALKLRGAVSIAFVFEIIGAVTLGGAVTDAVRTRVLNFDAFHDSPGELAMGMMCASTSATIWLMCATWLGMPVSTTHSIIGALAGFGVASGRVDSVRWMQIFYIFLSWIVVPLVAVVFSCMIYILLQETILKREKSYRVLLCSMWLLITITSLPLVVFLAFENPFMKLRVQEGKIFEYQQWFAASHGNKFAVIVGILVVVASILTTFSYLCGHMRIKSEWSVLENQRNTNEELGVTRETAPRSVDKSNMSRSMEFKVGKSKLEIIDVSNMGVTSKSAYESLLQSAVENEEDPQRLIENIKHTENHKTETMFSAMQIIGAVTVIISHSANDTANAVAPFATVLLLYLYGIDESNTSTPWYVLLAGGICMSLGLAMLGYKVIKTVGLNLARVTPSRGYAIDTTAGSLVLMLSHMGIPLSSTHATVSSILGVGLVENLKSQNFLDEVPIVELKPQSQVFWKRLPIFKRITTKYVNLKLYRKIFVTWITTIFFSGIMSAIIHVVVIFCHKVVVGGGTKPTV